MHESSLNAESTNIIILIAKSSEEGKKQANPDVRRENTKRKNMARLKMKKLFQSYLKWD